MALGWYVASMVCGALWWSPGQTRPLRGQIVQFTFPLWRSGTAVFLASGSRCVTPRPFIGRDPAATHCAHTRLYYLYQKKCGQRASPLFTVALLAVIWRAASRACTARRSRECLGEPALVCVWQSVGALLSGAHRLLYGIRTSRLVYAPWIEYTNESHSSVQQLWDRLWPGPKTMCTHRVPS